MKLQLALRFLAWFTFGGLASVAAQTTDGNLHPIGPSGLRDAGAYHLISGTWTAGVSLTNVVYNNTARTGWWTSGGIAQESSSFQYLDAGRLPDGPGSEPRELTWSIGRLQIAYCVEDDALASGPLSVRLGFTNLQTPCGDPAQALMLGEILLDDLPGADPLLASQGLPTCWTLQVVLEEDWVECLSMEGDGVLDQTVLFDSFGITLEFDPGGAGGYVGNVAVGPVLAGDPAWTAAAPQEYVPGLGGGGGTLYGPVETCQPSGGELNSSGLSNEDGLWIGARPAQALPAGCYDFGGYHNPFGCNANGTWDSQITPPASLYLAMEALPDCHWRCHHCAPDPTLVGTPFCDPAAGNSTGSASRLQGRIHTSSPVGVLLEWEGGVPGEFGYLLVGTAAETAQPTLISDGWLCLALSPGQSLGRYNLPGVRNSIGRFDAQGQFANLAGTGAGGQGFLLPAELPFVGSPTITAGSTWHFQGWYRDTVAGPQCSNLTNGWSISF